MIQLRTAESRDLSSLRGLMPAVLAASLPCRPRLDTILRIAERLLSDTITGASPEAEVVLAEDRNGTPLGFIHLRLRADGRGRDHLEAVADLAVHPESGRPGVGRALTTFAEGWTRRRGVEGLTLTLFGADPAFRTFHSTFGHHA